MYRSPNPLFVRFSDFHPQYQTESFFYNVLLQRVAFRSEAALLSPANLEQSYFSECRYRGLVADDEVRVQKLLPAAIGLRIGCSAEVVACLKVVLQEM